ncbi:Elongator complex protein 1 [Habropoda laboriosa]|uniref:Elongator complex protein 1 n=1 Tax=Habropoda laboriosa TaxID=597456 RepID=A0A0L7RCB5_9HYME|nr:PREDICTED: putative elongator complex protein 1 [Habropoda laboriosa]KOC68440.1 Elongator complex protein 1 [Habropoda laboriosa]
MKNLSLTKRVSRVLNFLEEQILNLNDSKVLHTVNSINDDFYVLLKNKLYKIPSNFEEDISSFDIDENLEFISLEYCSISQELYGACKSGNIMRINIESKFECELITGLNVDLQCMKLSPDHEMIILVTVNDLVITMVSTFQIISEVDLHAPHFGQKQFITVGWGKKETQFHGSEGKKAAVTKSTEMNKNDLDDGLCRITWRDDGSLFAVGFLHHENKIRQFKIFNREGILQYTSELVNSLEESLSWKPSGSLIASTHILQNKHVVVFFEKNGLRHRDFSLPFKPKEIKVKDLFWSPDSEILVIWCQIEEDSSSVLQLWTENNYHWYLKQSIKFPMDNSLICATWSATSFSKKLILVTSKELITCDYNWSVNHSRGTTVQDKCVVGVIDGYKSLMTGLRIGIVPPPMTHHTLEIPEPINAIVFAPDVENKDNWVDSNTFFCVSSSNKLVFYKHITDSVLLEYKHVGTYDIKWVDSLEFDNSFYNMHHFLWLDESNVLCSLSTNNQSYLCILTLNKINDQAQGKITVSQMHIMDGLIQHIIPSPDSKEAYIVMENSIVKYTKETELIPIDVQLQDYTYKVEVVKLGAKHAILSLYHRNCFAINGKEIANNITSFFVHSEFLLLTTAQHTLICVNLNEEDFEELIKQDLTIKPWENQLNEKSFTDLNIRRVERGSQLIAAISKDSKTILQMPRGNLECIQPRTLSLYIIGFYLDNCDYLSAFDLMRKQRINLNLIYDHDPEKFIENANKFVEQISKASWLSLFLSELTDENVTMTIYAKYYGKHRSKPNISEMNKLESVCILLRNIMEKRNSANHLIQPILISLVKDEKKQGLEAALTKINEIRKLEEKSTENEERITSDGALKYLLYIVDVNVLFDIALGMYDFNLTMFIASKSQKDPKEYIPFLNDLKKLDENYMKYSIDLHLKRYDSALENIAKESNRFNECINLICNYRLYKNALKLFERNSEQYKEVAKIYGKYLMKTGLYEEAGIMFHRSGDLKDALNAHKLAGNWQDVIIISSQMELSETEKYLLYEDITKRLKSDKRYEEAAQVLRYYLKNVEEAIISLCNGKHWKHAIRIAHDTKNLDLIESRIRSSVYEHADHTMSQIIKNKRDFVQYTSRLAIVRDNISQRNVKTYDEVISDILSDTSSATGSTMSQMSRWSTLSRKSYRSSKNRRKNERKLFSLKEGGAFEDLALIQALYQIISTTYKEKNDLHDLIRMLVYFGDDERAENIQNCMEQFLSIIEKNTYKIWDKSASSTIAEMESIEFLTWHNFQGLSACQQLIENYIIRPPEANTSPWKLNIF